MTPGVISTGSPTVLIEGMPAARLADMTDHVGILCDCSTTVIVNGRPAARLGDGVACPLHGRGTIVLGSSTVVIQSLPAARMGDGTQCQ
jgi:uncharacterized Zn-binding protein involved in type VI secretion